MSAVLPSSLSPHVCVLPSPDLAAALEEAGLPPIHHLLQSFSPLQQVTTRTTSLATVALASFALRFSDLGEVEAACKEDEDARAGRTIDWIGGRIAKKAAQWLGDDPSGPRPKGTRTLWWEELRRCAEGDYTPSRAEGWNHPAAIILAVSTASPNPLAAITALHSRPIDLPQWVDPNILRYTLIVHTPRSTLNDEECLALFNAAKRQYGLHAHFLSLRFGQPANPVPLFTLPPRLPLAGAASLPDVPEVHELRMSPEDLQHTGKFVREFVVMSLIPWMERCVLDWNENFSANRRLPTRIFSSTRRFFGSSSSGSISSASAVTSPTSANGQQPPPASAPPQQRRLAEFTTILGDYKLAIPVWEAWRKEGRGGSEILPLLLAPSPAVGAHVAYALQPFQALETTAQMQYRALLFAVRWEVGVQDFHVQGGDRWLSWASGAAEEPYAAVLLAHAALIAARQGGLRRASMWYGDAARRMEKSGIKPLAIYFLRQADDLLRVKSPRMLSESFEQVAGHEVQGFPALGLRVEHSLARLLYATGDIEASVRLFASLFRPYTDKKATHLFEEGTGHAQGIIDDFRVAFEHVHSTGAVHLLEALRPAISFALPKATKLRFERAARPGDGTQEQWDQLDNIWSKRAKANELGRLNSRSQADVDESFWVDLALLNPLAVEVTLSSVTVAVEQPVGGGKPPTVEIIDEIILEPKERRTVSLRITAHHSSPLKITRLSYSFLSLLPMSESLARRGRRLHDTPAQRQQPTYAPDVLLSVDIGGELPRLDVTWGDRDVWQLLAKGELRRSVLHVRNSGTREVSDIWLTRSAECPVISAGQEKVVDDADVVSSENTLSPPAPVRIPLDLLHGSESLAPGDTCEVPLVVLAPDLGRQDICLLITFREGSSAPICLTRVHRRFDVLPILDAQVSARPRPNGDGSFLVGLDLENQGMDAVDITRMTLLSPSWSCSLLSDHAFPDQPLAVSQTARITFEARPWVDGKGGYETLTYVTQAIDGVLNGQPAGKQPPPSLDVRLSRIHKRDPALQAASVQTVAEAIRRRVSERLLSTQFAHIPLDTHPFVFPLYYPRSVDVVIHWSIPAEQRNGMLVLSNQLALGAAHGMLNATIERAESGKARRTMYAETQRAQVELISAVRNCEWNAEMNPLFVTVAAESTTHDFAQGACVAPVTFTVHNYSSTNPARFVLRLNVSQISATRKPALFVGQLAHRGTLQPHGRSVISAKVWLPNSGQYSIAGWRLETEVGATASEAWDTLYRYLSFAEGETLVAANAAV
ncbi:hypothetical protein AURDEDRAFT_155791 [Auricularia subglabra TFB-10046 SS5]|nr:hypothetical protein AURDEDRAFT_155791 [Auricularia subglabra TFB-10046 SS5]